MVRWADTVLFIISPASIGAKWCKWELAQVEKHQKRLGPIVYRPVENDRIPEGLAKLQHISFAPPIDFDATVKRLVEQLGTNIDWIRQHTDLADAARDWKDADQASDFLLRGAALRKAQSWLDARPPAAPEPTAEQLELLAASERASGRRRLGWAAGAIAVAVIASGLAGVAYWQRGVAIARARPGPQKRVAVPRGAVGAADRGRQYDQRHSGRARGAPQRHGPARSTLRGRGGSRSVSGGVAASRAGGAAGPRGTRRGGGVPPGRAQDADRRGGWSGAALGRAQRATAGGAARPRGGYHVSGVQPRRDQGGDRLGGPYGAALGGGQRAAAGGAARPRGGSQVGGVQPGRGQGGHRLGGSHGTALGRVKRAAAGGAARPRGGGQVGGVQPGRCQGGDLLG